MTNVKNCKIHGTTLDPVYIGTGGYNIGRVDNTIVKDTITGVPKIPGSSLGGNWRYYMALTLQDAFKDNYKTDLESRRDQKIKDLFEENEDRSWIKDFENNRWGKIKCAGQDDDSNKSTEEENTGHCGHCIVCKTFGYSKKNHSEQGRALFSDLNILFFPVYTYLGVKWISCERVLSDADINKKTDGNKLKDIKVNEVVFHEKEQETNNKKNEQNDTQKQINHINLGYLNLPIQKDNIQLDLSGINTELQNDIEQNLIIVPNSLFSQIVNANLEVRTSNSIDPVTGAAKEGALFTSEAIPRLTVLYGNIRIQDTFDKDSELSKEKIENALNDTKNLFEVLGVGGMNTRGFGRIKIEGDFKSENGRNNGEKNNE